MSRRWSFVITLPAVVVLMGAAQGRRPDLIISTLSTPDGLRQGACNRFEVTIQNLAPAGTTSSITIRLHIQYSNKGEGQHIQVLNGIGPRGQPGATQLVRFIAVAIPAVARASYTATVNPDGVVPEAVVDERNSASGSGTVAGTCPVQ